jgi:hypothetical protein
VGAARAPGTAPHRQCGAQPVHKEDQTMIRFLKTLALAAALFVAAAGSASAEDAITAPLAPVGGSGVRGTLAVEAPVGGISTLIVEPTGLTPTTRYEAFLHAGTPEMPSASGARLMGLLTVGADGRGRLMTAHATGTAAGVAFELTPELLADGDHLVLVREQGGSVVAAGAIPRSGGAPTQLPATGGVPPVALAGIALIASFTVASLALRGRFGGAR